MEHDIFKYKHIIWDFNGTLLDDTGKAVEVMNVLLHRRNMRGISRESYLESFGFPVIEYYRYLGFDLEKEDFNDIADEFVTEYFTEGYSCALQKGAIELLGMFSERNISQSILSASYIDHLLEYLRVLDIRNFFILLEGQDNIRGSSKTDKGKKHIRMLDKVPEDILYIGDTTHDLEVAGSIGCSHLLVANGHHKKSRLLEVTDRVVDSLLDLL
jgi:phosphoglycolate phosphatase